MEWLSGLFALLGVMLGLGIGEFRRLQERKERFRVMTFEKRLEAHQKAYYWWSNLNRVLNVGEAQEIHKVASEAREWFDNSCLFIDTNTRRGMVRLINLSHMYANGNKVAQGTIWDCILQTSKSIVMGIGFEYLPEEFSKPEELNNTM